MIKHHKMISMLLTGAVLLTMLGCNTNYKTTPSGLHYKFEKSNPNAQQVQEGDVLVGEMVVRFDTIETFNNQGHADRILQAIPSFNGDLYEGLLMMHVGDKASFYIMADTLAKFLQANQMPPFYKPGTGMKLYYDITLESIVTKDELLEEQNNYLNEMKERQQQEPADIAAYVKDNGITAKPTSEGLYVIVKKRGNGALVQPGKTVSIDYTGRLLDGTIFDSSVEADAIQGGLQQPGRKYEPMTYVVGKMGLIAGWEQGVMNQPAGSHLQLIIPSSLAYGSQGAGNQIPPYTPLVFDIKIVSVE